LKRIIVALLLGMVLFVACQKKTVPIITERKTAPLKELRSDTVNYSTIKPDTLQGKRLFLTRCSRCHGLPVATEYSAKRWDAILTSMLPKARLTNEQGIHVTAYIKAFIKD